MTQLAPIGGDHVGRRRQARGTAKFRHHFAPRVDALRTAEIFGVGHYAVKITAQPYGILQPPASIGIERYARLRKALVQCTNRIDFLLAPQHTAFELEVVET